LTGGPPPSSKPSLACGVFHRQYYLTFILNLPFKEPHDYSGYIPDNAG
jgi:hypothetical protein